MHLVLTLKLRCMVTDVLHSCESIAGMVNRQSSRMCVSGVHPVNRDRLRQPFRQMLLIKLELQKARLPPSLLEPACSACI